MHFPAARALTAGTDLPWHSPGPAPAVFAYPARTSAPGREPASGAARPVLLIHGFRGDHHGLSLIAHELRGHDAFVPDLPGFGRTPPPPEGLSLDFYAAHIAALARSLTETTGSAPLLVGHSFGSILAAHALARQPDISPGLGLLSPIVVPALQGSAGFLTQLTRLYYAVGRALPERAGSALLAHPLIVRAMSEVMATTRDRRLRAYIHHQHALHFSDYADRAALAQAYEVSIRHTVAEAAPGLAQAHRPVLLVAGDADLIAPVTAARDLRTELSDSGLDVSLTELPGAGHLIHYERPAETAAALASFAARLRI
ncbi:alpha/beta fold hydrolase [Brevibacterium album]|uniref:alpha/beta fold hydrolase n=1 Tax=Brevibacterium album TaxID=417948 RepID=UPI00040432E9|nr:alpha/beta hydrolase [Brevibacterium album]